MLEKASAVVKETPFLEFRLDYLEKPLLALPKLKHFLHRQTPPQPASPLVAARPMAASSPVTSLQRSKFSLKLQPQVSHRRRRARVRRSYEERRAPESSRYRIALIISHHDFTATKDLERHYKRILPFQPDFIKIVPTAKSLIDNVTLMRFIERMEDHSNIIGICMGDAGIISRLLGVRAGSAFTFAAATVGEETGPGQIAARTLIETYRIDQVDAATKVYGVAGQPHSQLALADHDDTAFRRETVNASTSRCRRISSPTCSSWSMRSPSRVSASRCRSSRRSWSTWRRLILSRLRSGACNTGPTRPGRQASTAFNTRRRRYHRPARKAHVVARGEGARAWRGWSRTRCGIWSPR